MSTCNYDGAGVNGRKKKFIFFPVFLEKDIIFVKVSDVFGKKWQKYF